MPACSGTPGAGQIIAPPTRIDAPAQAEKKALKGSDAVQTGVIPAGLPERPAQAEADAPVKLAAEKPVEQADAPPADAPQPRSTPLTIGKDGTGGDIPPRVAEVLKGRLRPPTFVDIDGDGKPDVEVVEALVPAAGTGTPAAGYRVSYRQPGDKAPSMTWLYDNAGRLVRFERDVDADGLADEILLNVPGGLIRVIRGGRGDACVITAAERGAEIASWNAAAGRPLAFEIIDALAAGKSPAEALGAPPDDFACWQDGLPNACRVHTSSVVTEIVPIIGDRTLSHPFPHRQRNRLTGELPSKPRPKTFSGLDAPEAVKTLPSATRVKVPAKSACRPRHLLIGLRRLILDGGVERVLSYTLWRPSSDVPPELRGLPSEIFNAWFAAVSPVGVLDLTETPLYKSRVYSFRGGAVDLELRDCTGDGRYETRVISRSRLETVTLRAEGRGAAKHFYSAGVLVETHEDADGDGRFERVAFHEDGAVVRVEIDTSGDGLVDRWELPSDGKVLIDTNADGIPDRWETLKGAAPSGGKQAAGSN
ncbi:MAG TPA: hypothetical protein ENN09_06780 [Planctomycetes bacterium]|nr:hypothetical protein [Planctomycetota bacterium]